jgi:hypothetical protein
MEGRSVVIDTDANTDTINNTTVILLHRQYSISLRRIASQPSF